MKSLRNYLALLCATFAFVSSKEFLSHKDHSHHHRHHTNVDVPNVEQEILSVSLFNDRIRYGAPYVFTLRGMLFKAGSRDH